MRFRFLRVGTRAMASLSGYTKSFDEVYAAELDYLRNRRDKLELNTSTLPPKGEEAGDHSSISPKVDHGTVGLALSGGGIRSATFNLGLLQGLAKFDLLKYVDYLSTVSGGGYIGSCLSSLLENKEASVAKEEFPFRFERTVKSDERKEIKHLRKHSNYLALDRSLFGLDLWRMVGMYLSGLVLTNLVPVALLIWFAYALHLARINVTDPLGVAGRLLSVSLVVFVAMVVVRWLATLRNLTLKARRVRGYIQGGLALVAAALAAIAGLILLVVYLPTFQHQVADYLRKALTGVSAASLLGLLAGLLKPQNVRLRKILRGVFGAAWVVLLPVFFAQLVRWLLELDIFEEKQWGLWPVYLAFGLVTLSFWVNTNRISLHHFYRDRLSEAYVIIRKKIGNSGEEYIESYEDLRLRDLHGNKTGLYHLINATLNVPDSKNRWLRGRGADIFLFSKFFCGAESAGYRVTPDYDGGETRLASAMAISGAAASPQMGTSTSRGLTFLMTLLNIRLNRWMPNPDPERYARWKIWPWYFFKELLGKGKESDGLLNLSDGGHHENLGIYPLIQRGCSLIIASDAGADPHFAMEDLANLLRKVRIDLGVNIEIDLSGLRQEPEDPQNPKVKNTPEHYAVGKIRYPHGPEGMLIYIKSSITGREPEDLLAYRRQNPSFPDETTADQFFDEAQFESYRKLGDLTGKDVFSQKEVLEKSKKQPSEEGFIHELFSIIQSRYERCCSEKQ